MSRNAEDGRALELSATAEAALDARLSGWASQRRLSDDQLAALRTAVLATIAEPAQAPTISAALDAAPGFDADWLWSLLRPVTDLVERAVNWDESSVPKRFDSWMEPFSGASHLQPYLRLA
jgi:hypothetical protein